jgi:hypothetical protein
MTPDLELSDFDEEVYDLTELGLEECLLVVSPLGLHIESTEDLFIFDHLDTIEEVDQYFEQNQDNEEGLVRIARTYSEEGELDNVLMMPETTYQILRDVIKEGLENLDREAMKALDEDY